MAKKDRLILLSALWLIFVCLAASVLVAHALQLACFEKAPCIETIIL